MHAQKSFDGDGMHTYGDAACVSAAKSDQVCTDVLKGARHAGSIISLQVGCSACMCVCVCECVCICVCVCVYRTCRAGRFVPLFFLRMCVCIFVALHILNVMYLHILI
jgi:hypothetical protein